MEFSFKNWNSHGLEWWYRSNEASCYISGIRAGWTFRPVSCESSMFFCAFSGCLVECLMFVVCNWNLLTCCVSMSYRDLIVVVISCLFFLCLLYHEFQCHVMSYQIGHLYNLWSTMEWYGKRLGNTNDAKRVLMSWERTSLEECFLEASTLKSNQVGIWDGCDFCVVLFSVCIFSMYNFLVCIGSDGWTEWSCDSWCFPSLSLGYRESK